MKQKYILLLVIIFIAAFLRLYKLNQNPPSLYWDEASLGYNAFAILTTGYDEHGEFLPLARFIAFGDYKPPGYIYSVVPFMALFGVNEFAIRFPSALAGILIVIASFILVEKMSKNSLAALATAALLAISPWSLQLSRAAFEAHLAALLNLLAIMFFLKGLKKPWFLVISAVLFVGSFYTFNANRVIAPLTIVFLGLLYFKDVIIHKKWLVISVAISVLLLLPSISYLRSRESRLRFDEVSIFTNLDVIKKSNERIARSGNTILARIIHNRRVYYAKEFIWHYIDHFKADYLFIHGDKNPRLSVQEVGELYLFELPLVIIGITFVARKHRKFGLLLLGWLLIAHIPSSVARETPHMLRTASVLPIYQILGGFGFAALYAWVRKKELIIRWVSLSFVSMIIVLSFIHYQHYYWVHYSEEWSSQWQYGYKQMVEKVSQLESGYDRIYVQQHLGRPYIYFLLYNRISPFEYLKVRDADRDWYGFWNVYGFGKYDFVGREPQLGERLLEVEVPGSFVDSGQKLKEVTDPAGKTVFEIGEP